VRRSGGPPVWLNEYHADFLVHDRLEAARRAAARRQRRVAVVLAGLGRRVRALL